MGATTVEDDGLHLRLQVFLAVNFLRYMWRYDYWRLLLLEIPLNNSSLLPHRRCRKVRNISANGKTKLQPSLNNKKFLTLPQVTNMCAVIKAVIRRRCLCNYCIDGSVDVRSLNSISMNAVVMTNQVTITYESSSTEIALVVLTCRTVDPNVNCELTLACERHRAAITT